MNATTGRKVAIIRPLEELADIACRLYEQDRALFGTPAVFEEEFSLAELEALWDDICETAARMASPAVETVSLAIPAYEHVVYEALIGALARGERSARL